jgi:hypothetical protein
MLIWLWAFLGVAGLALAEAEGVALDGRLDGWSNQLRIEDDDW